MSDSNELSDIIDDETVYLICGEEYARIPYGHEPRWFDTEKPCPDCGVNPGQLHGLGCDQERCPKCHGQVIGCDCFEEEKV